VGPSAIDNARLLLASNRVHSKGLGNQNDLVGRFLMDHLGAQIGRFKPEDYAAITKRFGFYGLKYRGRSHLYMHRSQERARLMHCAAYMMEEHS
jgi:hypothetical protein